MIASRWLCLAATVSFVAMAQGQAPPDEQRSAWRFRRSVTLPAAGNGAFVAVALPADVHVRSQPALRDVRLVDASGRDVPFLAYEDRARQVERRWSGALAEAQRERREYTTWTVDFGELVTFDRLVLDVPATDFVKRIALDVSVDGTAWRELGRDYWVFDRLWQRSRVHDTTIAVPMGEARYVRVQADDTNSTRLDVRGVTAVRLDNLAGATWSEETVLELTTTEGGRARYRVAVPDGYPVQRLALDADEAAFARDVTVYEQGREGERKAGEGLVYRLDLPGGTTNMERREIAVTVSTGGALIVEVANGDNPPLVNPRVRLSGPRTLLVTAATGPALTLYYGNSVTRAPVYELERFRLAMVSVPEYPVATVGPEVANPLFRQPAPLAFVAARGAVVAPQEWRFSRPLVIDAGEDLYTLTMTPDDVARLRPDAGDLRMVDEADRQVPYVVERDAASVSVPLSVTPASARAGRRQTSALRLTMPVATRDLPPARITGLRLQVAEAFFQRTAVVLQPRAEAPLGAATLASVTLASRRRDDSNGPVWVQVPLADVRATELLLEVADGDNAPLTVLQAQAVVPVPRVTFKAAPGAYRLLMGNPTAQSPSYELGLLRQEVLTYAAVPVDAATEAAPSNPEYQRGVTDYVREAPPRVVLWSALGLAVVVLLVLIRRILTSAS